MSERATVSYIPAIHQGYLNFLTEHPDHLLILGSDLIHEIPRLERDIRALDPEVVATAIGALGISKAVTLLNKKNVADVTDQFSDFILPDEVANNQFAQDYLSHKRVTFAPTFLRWDMKASSTQLPVDAETLKNPTEHDRRLMELALTEAEKSPDWWRQVGAAVETVDKQLLCSHNTHLPSPDYSLNTFGDPRANFNAGEQIDISKAIHAEALLIAQAANRGVSLEGATIAVTTFPCPNCAKLIAQAGFERVMYQDGYSLLDAQDTLKAFNVTLQRLLPASPPESQ